MCPRNEQSSTGQPNPLQSGSSLKDMAHEALLALAHLDGARLEELAAFCQALTIRGPMSAAAESPLRDRATHRELALLGRLLNLTKANLLVLRQLHLAPEERMEYRLDLERT